jgi:hypothetical protein
MSREHLDVTLPGAKRCAALSALVLSALASATGCSSSHGPPKLAVSRSTAGTRVAHGGVDVTVPGSWQILNRSPAFCGSRMGRVVYVFNIKHSPPAGGSCSTGAPVGPYVSIECEPFNPQPQGRIVKLGAIEAPELGATTPSGLTDAFFYLSRRMPSSRSTRLGVRSVRSSPRSRRATATVRRLSTRSPDILSSTHLADLEARHGGVPTSSSPSPPPRMACSLRAPSRAYSGTQPTERETPRR